MHKEEAAIKMAERHMKCRIHVCHGSYYVSGELLIFEADGPNAGWSG